MAHTQTLPPLHLRHLPGLSHHLPEELKTHAAIRADPLQHKVLLPERLDAKRMALNWPDNVTVGF